MSTATASVVSCDTCGRKNRVPAAVRGKPQCSNCHSPLPWIVEADDSDFVAVADESTVPVLVDLWAPWCGPCRMVSPVVESLGREFAGCLKVVKVNVDNAPAISRRFAVQGIPTLVVLDHGTVVASQTGAAPEPALRAWLEAALNSSN
jgi:thioredoxin 2